MPQKKVLLMIKVNVMWNLIDEFNEYWARENLPLLEEHGARHIGSYVNLVGGPLNEIVRLFEFEDLSHWEKFNTWLFGRKAQDNQNERTISPDKPKRYVTSMEEKLLLSIY